MFIQYKNNIRVWIIHTIVSRIALLDFYNFSRPLSRILYITSSYLRLPSTCRIRKSRDEVTSVLHKLRYSESSAFFLKKFVQFFCFVLVYLTLWLAPDGRFFTKKKNSFPI